MSVSASLVKELRDLTGAGMMDCKRALQETGGDVEAAQRLLREREWPQPGSERAGRRPRASCFATSPNRRGTLVAVGCETEPVSANGEFRDFAQHVLDVVTVEGPEAVPPISRTSGSRSSRRSGRTSPSAGRPE